MSTAGKVKRQKGGGVLNSSSSSVIIMITLLMNKNNRLGDKSRHSGVIILTQKLTPHSHLSCFR
jgi:hypothetical protein